MPRVHARLWRFCLSFSLIASLLAAPATVSATAAVKFDEHAVNMFCDAAGPEGEIHLFAGSSTEFGEFANLFAWEAPVVPGTPPDIAGESDDVLVVEAGGGATIEATIPLFDPEGVSLGDAFIDAVLTPTDEVLTLEPFREGNRWIKTTGTIAFMDVTGTLDLPGDLPDFLLEDLGCGGEIVDVVVFETQPHAFVNANEGIVLFCSWESNGTFAHLFAVNDDFGSFADASLSTEGEQDWFGDTNDVSLSATSLTVDIPLTNFLTGETGTASAEATFSLLGAPVTSTAISQSARDRVTEQGLLPDGTITFPTDEVFDIDGEHCFAAEFDSHFTFTPSSGPKPGGNVPVNDTPDGALHLQIGSMLNTQTGGTAPDAELQVTTCPDGIFDAFGHTLWYSFTGTDELVTIDTAGSNFDTVLAVYDDELNELACIDDVEFEPVGFTFQAALTVPTEQDATYYVQVGGFLPFFEEAEAEFGRLRLSID